MSSVPPVCILALSSHVPEQTTDVQQFQAMVREAAIYGIEQENPSTSEGARRIELIKKNSAWVCRLAERAGINKRHFVIPDLPGWYRKYNYDVPYELRAKAWREYCPQLAMSAVKQVLDVWGGDKDRITHVVSHTTTGWDVPGLSHHIMFNLELPCTARAVPVNFVGCQGGVAVMHASSSISGYDPDALVLGVAAEVQCAHGRFYRKNCSLDRSIYMPNILFGDAGAAGIFGRPTVNDGKNFPIWEFGPQGAHYIPNTRHVLMIGISDEHGEYLENSIKKELPLHLNGAMIKNLPRWLRKACGHVAVQDLEFAVHPGGMKLLQNFCKLINDLGHPNADHGARFSFKNLVNFGNLASCAIFFILDDMCRKAEKDHIFAMAMGPGVCLEYFGLRRYDPSRVRASNANTHKDHTTGLYICVAIIVALIAFIVSGMTFDDLKQIL